MNDKATSIPNHGGPAFPQTHMEMLTYGNYPATVGGMTIRDYFAAAALPGIIACPHILYGIKSAPNAAYAYADEMLAEREKKTP